jgi:hypothetical protein
MAVSPQIPSVSAFSAAKYDAIVKRMSAMANFLKFLVLVVGGAAILHKLGPALLGIELFSLVSPK